MNRKELIVGFLQDYARQGEDAALSRLGQRLPFCSEASGVAGELGRLLSELGRIRRIARWVIGGIVLALACTLPVILNPHFTRETRINVTAALLAGLVVAARFIATVPNLRPELLLAAMKKASAFAEKEH